MSAIAGLSVFLDTACCWRTHRLRPAERTGAVIVHAIAGRIKNAGTSRHCCLEFFSVATRLPPGTG
jgi:hypothetical protein